MRPIRTLCPIAPGRWRRFRGSGLVTTCWLSETACCAFQIGPDLAAPRPPSPARLFGVRGAATMPVTISVGEPQYMGLKLPRFGGHPNICVPGVHNGEDETTIYA